METNSDSKIPYEVVYSELHNELRRYRDYELTVATWYTAIFVAFLGFVVSAKYGEGPALAKFIQSGSVQVSMSVISIMLGAGSLCSIRWASRRHHEIRNIVYELLEPQWVKDALKPILNQKGIRPRHFIYIVQLSLVVATWLVIWVPKP